MGIPMRPHVLSLGRSGSAKSAPIRDGVGDRCWDITLWLRPVGLWKSRRLGPAAMNRQRLSIRAKNLVLSGQFRDLDLRDLELLL
jgi:hypothetical protein